MTGITESVCESCGRRITHGGSDSLAQAPQWWDESDEFMCPDGEKEHRPIANDSKENP